MTGKKTITKKEQFGIIEKQAEIKDASTCNANGICDNDENYQNCPQDCQSRDKEIKQTKILFWIIALPIILLAAIFTFVKIYRKKRRNYLV